MQIGEVFRVFRIANDMSIKESAEALECSAGFLSDVERCNKSLGLELMMKLASVYNVRLSDILKIQEDSCDGNWNYAKTLYEALFLLINKENEQ